MAVQHREKVQEVGFTLIELLLVIGIIAILAAIVVVAVNPQRQLGQTEDGGRAQSENQLEKAIYQYLIDEQTFPGDRSIPEGQSQSIPICRASYAESGGGGCINLDVLLDSAQSYIACLPRDGKETNIKHSGYTIYQEAGRAHINAAHMGEGIGNSACEKLPAPIAYWKLDETSAGATAVDESDNSYDGTPAGTGGPQPSTDTAPTKFSNERSLNFDGNDYVNVGTFNITGNKMTLSAWFKADTFGEDPRVISKAAGWANGETYWLIGINDGPDRLRFRLNTGAETSIDQGAPVTGVWTHIAAVYNGTIMRLYKDGTEIGSAVKSGNIRTGGAAVWIGANPPTVSDRPFDGLIDDVRVYNVAFTGAQILSLARGNP